MLLGRGFVTNVPPVITVPGAQSATSNVALAITGTSIADTDSNPQTVTLTVSHGTFSLASTTGLSFSVGDGTADATMTFSGSLANINTAIATITYTATAFYSGADSLAISTNDGSGGTDSDSIAITVTSQFLTDLVAYWKLENVNDSHTNGLTLTNNNSLTFGTGKVGNCANNFSSASSRYFSRASDSNLVLGDIDWTLACWFNTSTFAANESLMSKDTDTGREYSLYVVTSGQVTILFGSTFAQTLATTTGAWHLAIGWHDASANTLNVQVDNAAPVSAATGGAAPPTGSTAFRIGAMVYPGFPQYFTGSIDEAAIWKRVLTSDERTQLYNSGNGVTYPTFV